MPPKRCFEKITFPFSLSSFHFGVLMADKFANVSQPKNYKLIVEKDVKIPLRDGTVLYADIFRPDGGKEGGGERFPAIMNISVYQKDKVWIPPADLEEKANPHMNWETVNP